MKLLLESWRKYTADEPSVIPTREEMVDFLTHTPNQKIRLDNPIYSKKGFGRIEKVPLPFDYGEYRDIINPADKMGWDLIIVPSETKRLIAAAEAKGEPRELEFTANLLMPVGHVEYSKDRRDKQGNDKIIIAPSLKYTEEDRAAVDNFFNDLEGFQPVRWY